MRIPRGSVVGAVAATMAVTAVVLAWPASASVAKMSRASLSNTGAQGRGDSNDVSVSLDGRYVAFDSTAANLVAGDNNGSSDVFVRDRTAGTTTLVSVASDGTRGNGPSGNPSISADGRYVAFQSQATNLVPGGTDGQIDVYVRDLTTGRTALVSAAPDGSPGNASSSVPSISADGRHVAFTSQASDLVPGDTNGFPDVFVRDLGTHTTALVSVAPSGGPGNNMSGYPAVSGDGHLVAFSSAAGNLVPGDVNGVQDVFVRDLRAGTTTRVDVSSSGVPANRFSQQAAISANGRYVAFGSAATNLVPGDTNGVQDVFVRDLQTGATNRVSVASDGTQGTANSTGPTLSADGRYVAFLSGAPNLVPGDTNGWLDVFVRDRQAQTTVRASVSGAGVQGNSGSLDAVLTGDGRYVAFCSDATNLTSKDTNLHRDVFLRLL